METKINLDNLLSDLKSNDPETLISALDECVSLASLIARAAVPRIQHPDVGLFVAERLSNLIWAVTSEIEKFLATSTEPEERVNAAAVLLKFGSRSGIQHLLDAVDQKGGDPVFAANQLTRAGVVEAADHIVELLRCGKYDDPIIIRTLIDNLEKLNAPLPPDLRDLFSSEDAHPWVRQAVLGQTAQAFEPAAHTIPMLATASETGDRPLGA